MADSLISIELRECLALAKAGDAAARERLFSMCRSYLDLLARANVEPWMQAKQDASDLVQQTLLDAHRDFDRFAGSNHHEWLGWLRQILNHNVQDAFRYYGSTGKRAARREVSLGMLAGDESEMAACELASPCDSPSQIVIHNEREVLLADAIAQLSDDHREVIILRNIQRLPFDEVAARLGRTRAATQMLWMRAIQKLKSILSVGDSAFFADGVSP